MVNRLERFNTLMQSLEAMKVQDRNYVLQTTLPDGLHWYGGTQRHPKLPAVNGNLISPYFDDALTLDFTTAQIIREHILDEPDTFSIVLASEAVKAAKENPYQYVEKQRL